MEGLLSTRPTPSSSFLILSYIAGAGIFTVNHIPMVLSQVQLFLTPDSVVGFVIFIVTLEAQLLLQVQ